MRKLPAAIALATVAALALSACGRSDNTSSDSAAGAGSSDSGKVSGTIEVWAMGTEGELLPQLTKKFEDANPGVKVKVTPVPWDSASQKITTAITSGVVPDVLQVGTTWLAGFQDMGGLAETPSDISSSGFFPGAWDTTVVDGTSYGVPWYVETRVLYYRSDLAQQAGVELPKTWDDLKAFTKGMQSAGAQYGIQLQTSGQDTTNMWLPFFWQAGGSIMSEDGKTFTLDTDAAAKSIDYYASFMKEGIAPQVATDDNKMQNFVDGQLGSFVSGPWDVSNVNTTAQDSAFDSQFSVAALPADQTSGSFLGGADLSVMKDAKNPTGGWALVKFLTDPANQMDWYKISSDLPSQESAWSDSTLANDSRLAVFGEALKTAKSVPAIPTWTEIGAQLDKILEKAIAGDIDGATAAKQMQDAATSIGTSGS